MGDFCSPARAAAPPRTAARTVNAVSRPGRNAAKLAGNVRPCAAHPPGTHPSLCISPLSNFRGDLASRSGRPLSMKGTGMGRAVPNRNSSRRAKKFHLRFAVGLTARYSGKDFLRCASSNGPFEESHGVGDVRSDRSPTKIHPRDLPKRPARGLCDGLCPQHLPKVFDRALRPVLLCSVLISLQRVTPPRT